MAAVILFETDKLDSSEATQAAERGLGLQRSRYWYILHAEPMFGHTVFSARASIVSWQPHEGGACPFDSGGIWYGRIATDPPLPTGESRRTFFEGHDQALGNWHQSFAGYLTSNYDKASDYILGRAPRHGVAEIMKISANTSQAWTWEARARREVPLRDRLELVSVYWRSPDRDQFQYWVESGSSYDDSKQESLLTWVRSHSRICALSESPAIRATLDLIQDFGG